ncbi:uncharacterized protein LOC118644902 [Monomorium pharaonis]|uniref:uncharacterized protein LOC118644902 n=1 Tax=Monomorium pharaonis TaxID=307658 RepID=UPI0017475FE5|nr:uncharacterized protein LOC118644902 [Monomorium pharaonis]
MKMSDKESQDILMAEEKKNDLEACKRKIEVLEQQLAASKTKVHFLEQQFAATEVASPGSGSENQKIEKEVTSEPGPSGSQAPGHVGATPMKIPRRWQKSRHSRGHRRGHENRGGRGGYGGRGGRGPQNYYFNFFFNEK